MEGGSGGEKKVMQGNQPCSTVGRLCLEKLTCDIVILHSGAQESDMVLSLLLRRL